MRKKLFIPIFAVFSALLIFSSACEKEHSVSVESGTALPETTAASAEKNTVSKTEKITEKISETSTEAPEPETDRTFTQITSQPYGESVSEQNIIMFSIYENHAWSFCQHVDVLAADGSCYSFYTEDLEESFKPWKDENWYARLEEIAAEEESLGYIIEADMETIRAFKDSFSEYSDCPYKVYDNSTYDWGTSTLYGVYLDENSVPRYAELCSYGDWVTCIYDSDVMDFVNSIDITFGKLHMDGEIFFHTDYEFDY